MNHINITNESVLELMSRVPYKYFDLGILDPSANNNIDTHQYLAATNKACKKHIIINARKYRLEPSTDCIFYNANERSTNEREYAVASFKIGLERKNFNSTENFYKWMYRKYLGGNQRLLVGEIGSGLPVMAFKDMFDNKGPRDIQTQVLYGTEQDPKKYAIVLEKLKTVNIQPTLF